MASWLSAPSSGFSGKTRNSVLYLLNPRVLIVAALVAILAFTHYTAYRKGKHHVELEWKASVAAANEDALRLERARQSRVDQAARAAAAREDRLRSDASRAGDSLQRLRHAIAAHKLAEESRAAAIERADTAEQLLIESATAYRELAEKADRHATDVQTLLDAWPR